MSGGSSMTTNTAGTKKPAARPAVKPAARVRDIQGVSPTIRKIRLAAGERPFMVVTGDGERIGGWVFPIPGLDDADPLLREQGHQAPARRQPCYLMVPMDLVK